MVKIVSFNVDIITRRPIRNFNIPAGIPWAFDCALFPMMLIPIIPTLYALPHVHDNKLKEPTFTQKALHAALVKR